MNIFNYGRIYSKLSPNQIKSLKLSSSSNEKLLSLSKIYFFLFGYPDVAGQRKYMIIEKLLKLKKSETILDAGTGNGIYLQEFGNRYLTSGVGIDARVERIKAAEKINKYLKGNNVFITSTLEKVNLGHKRFDKIICLEVLEHIVNDIDVLKKLTKSLDKGGLLIISVPMKGTGLTKKQQEDPNFKPEKYGHVRSGYDERELRKLAINAGLKVVSIQRYFFFVSKYAVKFQQLLYKKGFIILNLIFSPLLLIISGLDSIFKFSPRGYIAVFKKNSDL
jgi:2-polyprenyl-3-methyl-5-hydroxy-6-metoxy-1,4-benzoquinol methylase